MFVRVIKGKCKSYVSIVRNYKDGNGKYKQKTVQSLGSFKNEEEKNKLFTLGRNLIASMEGKTLLVAEDTIVETKRENWGATEVIDQLFSIFKLDECFNSLLSNRKIQYNFLNIIKLLIIDRFLSPRSKLSTFNHREELHGFSQVQLQHLYRALDELHQYKAELSAHLFKQQKKFAKDKIKVVFFDVTTLYFESQKADDLREFGFSKDCKFNEVQVVLSLLINSDGRPIGYEIFPGNHYEGHTLLPCLKQLQEKYKINEVVIVADRGLSSFDNLQVIKEHGFDYIIASRLAGAPKAIQKMVLDQNGYTELRQNGDGTIKYKLLDETKSRKLKDQDGVKIVQELQHKLLCIYSSKRARKDQLDRARLVTKAQEMLKTGSYKDKRGAKKYITTSQNSAELNLSKIEADKAFDGFYTISYSRDEMSAKDVIDTYHSLWKIEESFRTMKSFFEARPMFHWTAKRISGHIMLNFIGLIFERHIELGFKALGEAVSPNTIREAIAKLQRSILKIGDRQMASYAPICEEGRKLLALLNIKMPKNHTMQ